MPNVIMDTVLLVDDTRIDNFITKKVLDKSGYVGRVHVYQRARAALKFLSDISNQVPDLLLLDVDMPDMDGFGLLDAMRELSSDRRPRRIVMLTNMMPELMMRRLLPYPEVSTWMQKPLMASNVSRLRNLYPEHQLMELAV